MQEFIEINHGSLTAKVPSSMFSGCDAAVDADAAENYKDLMSKRYPWLTSNSIDVLIETARKRFMDIMDEETMGLSKAERLRRQGRLNSAEDHLRRCLERYPENADLWYALGKLLCSMGKTEDGYAAFGRGGSLIGK